jgi:hypothetical protein
MARCGGIPERGEGMRALAREPVDNIERLHFDPLRSFAGRGRNDFGAIAPVRKWMAARSERDDARSLLLEVKANFSAERDSADLTAAAQLLTIMG